MKKLALIPAAAAVAIAVSAGAASANAFTADASCDGLAFSMPRGEADTVVTVRVDGVLVRTVRVAAQFDPVAFTVPSPDRTVAHTWVVFVDSRWNADQTFTRTAAACAAPTTTQPIPPSSSPSTTSAPAPSTSVPPPGSTVAVSSSTIVTPPRQASTTTSTLPPVGFLPATGGGVVWPLTLAALASAAGVGSWWAARRGVRS